MKTLTPKQALLHKSKIKQFHTILRGDKEAKAEILHSYGVSSSLDLTIDQLIIICDTLNGRKTPKQDTTDRVRKQVLAAIGGWYKAIGKLESANNIDYIKATACRAAQAKTFNSIPLGKLRAIYGEYCKKQEMKHTVQKLKSEEIDYLSIQN